MTSNVGLEAQSAPPAPKLADRVLIASYGVDEAKALCWAIRMAASALVNEHHRDGIRAIEDVLMEKLDAVAAELDAARAELES